MHVWLVLLHCYFNYPLSPLVVFQLVVVNETVCESAASAMVCVQLKTDTKREATATVQTSDLSARSKSYTWWCY